MLLIEIVKQIKYLHYYYAHYSLNKMLLSNWIIKERKLYKIIKIYIVLIIKNKVWQDSAIETRMII